MICITRAVVVAMAMALITTTMAIPPMSGEMAVMLMIKLQWTPKMRTTMADGADAEWQRKCLVNV